MFEAPRARARMELPNYPNERLEFTRIRSRRRGLSSRNNKDKFYCLVRGAFMRTEQIRVIRDVHSDNSAVPSVALAHPASLHKEPQQHRGAKTRDANDGLGDRP